MTEGRGDSPVKTCNEPGCPVDVGPLGDYCAHHNKHSAQDGECGPGCPPPWPNVPGRTDA